MFQLVPILMVGKDIDCGTKGVIILFVVGFFLKENYGFLQFSAGLDDLQPDATAKFVTAAVIVSFALPILVGAIAVIIILKRRFSRQPTRHAYGEINN